MADEIDSSQSQSSDSDEETNSSDDSDSNETNSTIMSTNQPSTIWVNLASYPATDCMEIPTPIDRNNYIIIDNEFYRDRIACIYKYNIDNDKWTKINGFNNIQNISAYVCASLDVKKQILFLWKPDQLTQIQLNN
eukprot:146652_1